MVGFLKYFQLKLIVHKVYCTHWHEMLSLLHTASGLLIQVGNLFIFSYFSTKIYVVGTLKNCLNETFF